MSDRSADSFRIAPDALSYEGPILRRPLLQRLGPLFTPSRLFVGSFVLLILLGTLALKWLPGVHVGEELSWLDALFTSTSAVCVTGLIVVDTATYFTPFGQGVILFLIQAGGLGMITFASLIIIALGRRLSLQVEAVAGAADITPQISSRRLLRGIVVYTFGVEAIGFLLLWWLWTDAFGARTAAWHALFHSISAFCNAGFSTFSDSMIGMNRQPMVLGVVSGLIIIGGLGFLVLEDLRLTTKDRLHGRHFRLSLHTLLVLGTTVVLLLGGFGMLTWFEWGGQLGDMSVPHRLSNGMFMSVTARTAGFNSVDYRVTGSGTNFLTILLMSIGGAPGSTAGGLKVTTFAVIGLLAWNRMRGRRIITLVGRSVHEEAIQRAVGLVVVAVAVIVIALLVLTQTESFGDDDELFLDYLFECVSAFNTVGLSLGPTGDLSVTGRWVVIVLMFLGRVGPLTFAATLARGLRQRDRFRYAYEEVVVG